MPHFTEEQLKEIQAAFGLKRQETQPVRDGQVTRDSMVWWRSAKGPQLVRAGDGDHWLDISEYPDFYQIEKPTNYRVEYMD